MAIVSLLFFGDVVGRPGRRAVEHAVPILRAKHDPDLIIANGENSAAGSGITDSTFQQLLRAGVQVVTSGDHIFRNKEFESVIQDQRLLRPANYPKVASGRGWGIFEARGGIPVGVLNLMGRIFMEPLRCPFETAEEALAEVTPKTKIILVDMHAEATSEKVAMGWYLDGRVSAVVGTHTHIQTADERILHHGTAFLSDAGMSGPYDSVIGRDKDAVLKKMTTGMPARFEVAEGEAKACGAVIQVDSETGQARSIERFQIREDAEA